MNVLELLWTLLYAIVGVVLTAGGLAAEYMGYQQLGGGELIVAVWFVLLGAIMLYAGVYGIGYQKLLSRATARS